MLIHQAMPHRSMDPAVGNGEARTVQPRPAPQAHFHVVVSAERMYGAGDYLSDVVQPDFAAMKEALAAETG